MSEGCQHIWGEGEDWVWDGENENHIMTYECELCFQRMIPDVVNAQVTTCFAEVATLRALLREAAPKCWSCEAIATRQREHENEGDVAWDYATEYRCEEHGRERNGFKPYELGIRIKVELEETT